MLPRRPNILLFAQNLFRERYQIDLDQNSKNLTKDHTSYWPSDDCDTTDDELQQDPPEASIDNNSVHKTYTYVSFDDNLQSATTQMTPFNKELPR